MKYSFLLIPVFFFQFCNAQPVKKLPSNTDDNTLLWEISGNGLTKPSYLFGTFHLMCRENIHFSDNLKEALHGASEVYFEMDLDDASNTLGAVFFMNMKDGKTLKDLYNDNEYARITTFFKDSLRTGLAMFQRMKPGFLAAMLYPKMMPCKNMSGVEQELLAMVAKDKKEIKGFETIANQSAAFDSIPLSQQASELLKSIDSFHSYQKNFDQLIKGYLSQQITSFDTLFTDTLKGGFDARFEELLLNRRNRNWVDQLKKILPEKNIFIAVGAGHLVGEQGLIALLRKQGYTLRPILNK